MLKAFYDAKSPKYDRYQSGLASMVYKFLGSLMILLRVQINLLPPCTGTLNNSKNQQLADELHKTI